MATTLALGVWVAVVLGADFLAPQLAYFVNAYAADERSGAAPVEPDR